MIDVKNLEDLLHIPGRTQKEKLLLVLAVDVDSPKLIMSIKKMAMDAGVKDAKSWNIPHIAKSIKQYAISNSKGFKLNSTGKRFVASNLLNKSFVPLNVVPLANVDFNKILTSNKDLAKLLTIRRDEIHKNMSSEAYLSAMILLGSILEGLLLYLLQKNIPQAMTAKLAPKDKKTRKPIPVNSWGFSSMIDVADELGWIKDTKKFGHDLRDYRNCIHPLKQLKTNIFPTKNTVTICVSILEAAINEMESYL